jgi:hypothetical protein
MFTINELLKNETEKQNIMEEKPPVAEPDNTQLKYKNILSASSFSSMDTETNYNTLEKMLEKEKQHNKTEAWIKLDKTVKIQKLHQYAEKYGKEHSLPVKDIKSLKAFFVNCLEKDKLNKTKDVIYAKETAEISSVPALHFNQTNRNFTLKIIDTKRVSTLKSLTPKRLTEKNKQSESEAQLA